MALILSDSMLRMFIALTSRGRSRTGAERAATSAYCVFVLDPVMFDASNDTPPEPVST